VRSLAYPLAVLLVAALCFGAVALAVGAVSWGRWALRVGGAAGVAGVVLTAVAAVNLAVPRTCAELDTATGPVSQTNRPAISVVLDDGPCFRSGLAQVQLVVLAVLATTIVTLAADRRVVRR
jgi:hypothetical protein